MLVRWRIGGRDISQQHSIVDEGIGSRVQQNFALRIELFVPAKYRYVLPTGVVGSDIPLSCAAVGLSVATTTRSASIVSPSASVTPRTLPSEISSLLTRAL